MNFVEFRAGPLTAKYPGTRFDLPVDRSAWANDVTRKAMSEMASLLEPGCVIVELGSFLGAGSTHAFLTGNPRVNLVCIDTWACEAKNVDPATWPDGRTPFFAGNGEAWQHFVNNTWDDRHRVAPVRADASAMCLRMIYATGMDVGLVFIDADHSEWPVFSQLRAAVELWPRSTIVLDDYHPLHPGVIRAVDRAMRGGVIQKEDIIAQHDRLLVIERKRAR